MKNIFKNPMFYLAIAYLLFPVDILPDAIPVAGTCDDAIMVLLALIVQNKLKDKNNTY